MEKNIAEFLVPASNFLAKTRFLSEKLFIQLCKPGLRALGAGQLSLVQMFNNNCCCYVAQIFCGLGFERARIIIDWRDKKAEEKVLFSKLKMRNFVVRTFVLSFRDEQDN